MFKNTKALSKEDKEYGEFAAFKAGAFVLRNEKVEIGEADEKEWSEDVKDYVPTGRKIPQIILTHGVYKSNGSNEVLNVKGETIVGAQIKTWINDMNLGWNKKENVPKDGRAVITASLGLAPDAEIPKNLDPVTLLNKKFTCLLQVTQKPGKNPKNKMTNVEAFLEEIPGIEDVDINEEGRVKKN